MKYPKTLNRHYIDCTNSRKIAVTFLDICSADVYFSFRMFLCEILSTKIIDKHFYTTL